MDRIAALRAFVAVVDEGGFAAAARALGLSRSGVNRLVMGLEDQLGAQLLTRSTRKVNPTSTGAAFHTRAVRILEALDEAERAVRAEDTEVGGELAISAPVTFGTAHIGPLVAEFMARHPALRIRLDLSDRAIDLIGDGYDLAVRIGAPREDVNLVDFRVCQSRLVLCASPDLAADPALAAGPMALRTLPCLDYVIAGEGRPWRLDGPDGAVRVAPNRMMISNNGEVLRDAALASRGIAQLPTFIVGPALADGRLVEILPGWTAPTLTLAVVSPPARHLSAKVRLFTDFVMERFGDVPPWAAEPPCGREAGA
ncbi:LysR substrate-binding domain-containing protein [Acuticoccus sp. MNP-M23]|uniref:LysR family transcriptional regulator n=1 Tax=Acuticoccus sp. MNP-M23 TaxID=3072793 RepID=UPI0028152AEA|nr:LysR substrate-binding domain-containing protein [Acuticoccus sp. MNP-M23]WMS42012.1 LysR substrate-binding domain-containing protein [Acuticoccus sp. MNP-M23]